MNEGIREAMKNAKYMPFIQFIDEILDLWKSTPVEELKKLCDLIDETILSCNINLTNFSRIIKEAVVERDEIKKGR